MRGMTISLVKKTQTGSDAFGVPTYKEELVTVDDVLVGQPTTDDVNNSISLYGKRCDFVLGIPRGDTNDWTDAEVEFFGERFRTIGCPMRGIDENVPLRWTQNVKVTRYG